MAGLLKGAALGLKGEDFSSNEICSEYILISLS